MSKTGKVSDCGGGHRVPGNRGLQRNRRHAGKRIVGWEFVHVCVDDAPRLAYVEVLADEKATSAVGYGSDQASSGRNSGHHFGCEGR